MIKDPVATILDLLTKFAGDYKVHSIRKLALLLSRLQLTEMELSFYRNSLEALESITFSMRLSDVRNLYFNNDKSEFFQERLRMFSHSTD